MSSFGLLNSLAWRNLWRNPRRTAITIIVVAAALYSILNLTAILQGWALSSRDTTLDGLTGSGQIHAQGYLDDPTAAHLMHRPDTALRDSLDHAPIAAWTERVRVSAVIQSEYRTLPISLVGVLPQRERRISTLPSHLVRGRYITSADDAGIVLGRHLAQRLRTRIGHRVLLLAQSASGSLAQRSFRVVGLFGGTAENQDAFAFTGLATAQKMLDTGNAISEISFKVRGQGPVGGTVSALARAAPGLDVRPWQELAPLAAAMNQIMNGLVYIWLWIMFSLMTIGIVNTELMTVFERTREFGLLRALGMRPGLVVTQVAIESTFLVGIGIAIGMVLAALTLWGLSGGVNFGFLARGAEFFGARQIIYPALSLEDFVSFSLLIWVLSIVVSLWPAVKAARSNPIEAMSHES